jgi:hypothetical protein
MECFSSSMQIPNTRQTTAAYHEISTQWEFFFFFFEFLAQIRSLTCPGVVFKAYSQHMQWHCILQLCCLHVMKQSVDLCCDWNKFMTLVTSLQNLSIQEACHHPSISHWRMALLVRNGKYTENNITTDNRHKASARHPRKVQNSITKLFQENWRYWWSMNKRLVQSHTWHNHVLFYTMIMRNMAKDALV